MGNTLYKGAEKAKEIIDKCDVCYVGMVDQNHKPYVLPFNFGLEDGIIYLHSAPEGKKIDILKLNPTVCVVFSTDHKLFHRHEPVACSYGMKYKSVLAHGKVEFIEDYDEKVKGMNILMRKYAGRDFEYNAPAINNLSVYRVIVDLYETKESGY